MTRKAMFREVKLSTSAGPLLLRDLECWIHEADESLALTIGRPVMVALGYSTNGMLAAAREKTAGQQAICCWPTSWRVVGGCGGPGRDSYDRWCARE